MHRASSARWLHRALNIGEASAARSVPLYLCPLAGYGHGHGFARSHFPVTAARHSLCAQRFSHSEAIANEAPAPEPKAPSEAEDVAPRKLPLMCTGCGAFTQTSDAQQFGYFDVKSKRVQKWMHPQMFEREHKATEEDRVVDMVLKSLDRQKLDELQLDPEALKSSHEPEEAVPPPTPKQPVCERCHNLINYGNKSDTSRITMYHPTAESLRETIEESPHKYNHIYHIIDAADFPMSLIPRLNVLLGDIPMRSRNRRSRSAKYMKDRRTELSFIITRGDLLGPTKEIVDSMMPRLRDILRDALGRIGGRVRLGNVRCVSAKRGWWTTHVKEDIWKRGGAGWFVGQVNVGKSQLFEAVYPKGRMIDHDKTRGRRPGEPISSGPDPESTVDTAWLEDVNVGELLPPPQPAKNYPEMPIVSSLPGTTAGPIRVPFGNGRGELIDLPGMARSELENYVLEDRRQDLIMRKRVVPVQHVIKPDKSIILGGGLIRLSNINEHIDLLMYNFTPLEEHATSTQKAIGFQDQTLHAQGVDNMVLPSAAPLMKSAGKFRLTRDVTAQRAGPLTRKNAIGLDVERLPFRVLATDILIEGVGYVEVAAQIRAKDYRKLASTLEPENPWTQSEPEPQPEPEPEPEPESKPSDPFAAMMELRRDTNAVKPKPKPTPKPTPTPKRQQIPVEDLPEWPTVEVFSPTGRFIGSRRPINGWMLNKPLVKAEHKKSRPRKSMKGHKKMVKRVARGSSR